MLIISKHKDYYDSAVGMGIDKTIVYKREENEFGLNLGGYFPVKNLKYPKQINDLYEKLYPFVQRFRGLRSIDFFIVGFCGKLYPAMRFNGLGEDDETVDIFYDVDEVIEKFKSIEYDKDYMISQINFDKNSESDIKNSWNDIMNTDSTDLHRKYNTPVFIINCYRTYSKSGVFMINPTLKDFKFVRVFDPYTAFQEIQMYLAGVLASGDDVKPIKMTEKEKVNQHGFDEKYGFRKRPKK